MATLDSGKIIRSVRHRLELSQEALSRLMNTTKGAVQHWERGRTHPGLARLLVLRQLCPASHQRQGLDTLIRSAQNGAGAVATTHLINKLSGALSSRATTHPSGYSPAAFLQMQRENGRLLRQVAKLESVLKRKQERLRILENLATDLQREMAQMRAQQ